MRVKFDHDLLVPIEVMVGGDIIEISKLTINAPCGKMNSHLAKLESEFTRGLTELAKANSAEASAQVDDDDSELSEEETDKQKQDLALAVMTMTGLDRFLELAEPILLFTTDRFKSVLVADNTALKSTTLEKLSYKDHKTLVAKYISFFVIT